LSASRQVTAVPADEMLARRHVAKRLEVLPAALEEALAERDGLKAAGTSWHAAAQVLVSSLLAPAKASVKSHFPNGAQLAI